jgi:hypothetical protein
VFDCVCARVMSVNFERTLRGGKKKIFREENELKNCLLPKYLRWKRI